MAKGLRVIANQVQQRKLIPQAKLRVGTTQCAKVWTCEKLGWVNSAAVAVRRRVANTQDSTTRTGRPKMVLPNDE